MDCILDTLFDNCAKYLAAYGSTLDFKKLWLFRKLNAYANEKKIMKIVLRRMLNCFCDCFKLSGRNNGGTVLQNLLITKLRPGALHYVFVFGTKTLR